MIDEPTVKRRLLHRAADLAQMRQVGAGADVHVQAGDREVVLRGPLDAVFELLVPDAVLRLGAAGVDLLAVAVAEAGIDPQRDPDRGPAAALGSPYWSIMSGEPQLTWMSCSTTKSSASRSKMSAVYTISGGCCLLARLEAGGDRAMHFAGAHAIDQPAVAAHQVENRQVGARLLGVADDVERRQVGDPLGDLGRVVNIHGRAELPGQIRNRLAGNFCHFNWEGDGGWHWQLICDSVGHDKNVCRSFRRRWTLISSIAVRGTL